MEKAIYCGFKEVEVVERGAQMSKIQDPGKPETRRIASNSLLKKPKLPRAIASALQEMSVTWNHETVAFVLALANSPMTHIYLETTNSFSKRVEDKYFAMTDEVIVPTPGAYNIVPEGKWGTEGTISFDPSIAVPESLGVIPEKDGTIGSVEMFWALIRLGFRAGSKHDVQAITKNVPTLIAA